jgi:hypothetical protein
MGTDRDWAAAYLAQGRADLRAAERLDGGTPSTAAMLLQMVFEKLAKAALLKMATMPLAGVKRLHHVASRLIGILRLDSASLMLLGDGDINAWNDALPLVSELEEAHPATPRDPTTGKPQLRNPGHPTLEYPWEDTAGMVYWPDRDLPIAQRFADPTKVDLPRLLKFAGALSKHHDALFP